MSRPRSPLGEGEEIWFEVKAHRKVLIRPVLALIGIAFAGSYGFFVIPPGGAATVGRVLVLVATLLVLIWWVAWPVLRWRWTAYVLTNRRLVVRTGVLSRGGWEQPVGELTDVTFGSSLLDRLLGYGTLTVAAGESGDLVLTHVPRSSEVHRGVTRLAERVAQQRAAQVAELDRDSGSERHQRRTWRLPLEQATARLGRAAPGRRRR